MLCLVEVASSDGETGIGESWLNFPSWGAAERYATFTQGVAPLLQGVDVSDVVGTHSRLTTALGGLGRQIGMPGAVAQAISGVDLALWDLRGRVLGVPVYQMIGGGRRRIPVYASGLGPVLDEQLVAKHLALGIQAFKIKVGFGADQDFAQVSRLRTLVGDRAHIMVDANQAWTRATALDTIRRLAPLGLDWVEEPLPADDIDGMAHLVAASPVPISAGENLYGRQEFGRWAVRGAFGVAQPDITKVGGLTEAWAIAHMMAAFRIPYTPHFLGGAVGLIATGHLFSAVPGGIAVELDTNPNVLRDSIVTPALRIEDGSLLLPDGPGWGLQLDEEVLRRYEVPWQQAIYEP